MVPLRAARFARPLEAVEGVESRADGERTVVAARKVVRSSDPYLSGHFPGLTLYPAVFLLEGLRQAVGAADGCWLEVQAIRSLRVRHPMLAGDELCLDIVVTNGPGAGVRTARLVCTRAGGPVVAEITAELVKGGTS